MVSGLSSPHHLSCRLETLLDPLPQLCVRILELFEFSFSSQSIYLVSIDLTIYQHKLTTMLCRFIRTGIMYYVLLNAYSDPK